MSFLAFHKVFSIKRKANIFLYLFFESGRSYYHLNLSKTYKISRLIDELYGLDREKRDLFYEIVQSNLSLIEKAGNQLPKVKVIRLDHLEADFIPYYLLRNKMVQTGPNVANIVYSNDHDLLQCLVHPNTYIYTKTPNKKRIIKPGEALKSYLKTEKSFPDSFLPLVMSIMGDPGDNVNGVRDIGSKRVTDIIEEVVNLAEGMDKVYEKIQNKISLFDNNSLGNENKYIVKVVQEELERSLISINLKLVSFEVLSHVLDNPPSTEIVERRKYVQEVCVSNKIAPIEAMKKALEMHNVYLEEDSLDIIYYGE
jgi:hypothetical protein